MLILVALDVTRLLSLIIPMICACLGPFVDMHFMVKECTPEDHPFELAAAAYWQHLLTLLKRVPSSKTVWYVGLKRSNFILAFFCFFVGWKV